jgi:hypothetical protein
MIGVLFILSLVWLGFVLDEEFSLSRGDFLVRLAAAIVLGCFWGAWIVFLLSWGFGFSLRTVAGGWGVILAFNLLAWRFRRRNVAWFASLFTFNKPFWQAGFVPTLLITAYFAVCVWTDSSGNILFRGNSQDLAFHMATVSAFLEQSAFPPFNPQSAAAKLSYHFMADFFSAILGRGGFSLFYALKIPMVLFAFSFCSLTCHLLFSVLKMRTATVFAGLLFFFGHIGVINLVFGLAGYPSGSVPLSLGSWSSLEDHLTYPYYNFLSVVIDYFQPQLPFLFGFPLAMLVLVAIHRKYTQQAPTDRSTYFILALIAFLPLFHIHTFLTIGPLVGLMVLFERAPPRALARAGDGFIARLIHLTVGDESAVPTVSGGNLLAATHSSGGENYSFRALLKILALFLAAIPIGLQLGFVLSQEKAPGFSGFDVPRHLGDLPEIPNFLHLQRCWFWLRAAGTPLVLGLIGLFFSLSLPRREAKADRRGERALLAFLFVTGFYFLVINVYRFTPNWGDSNKFFLYLDLVLCIYAGRLLAFCWKKSLLLSMVAGLLVSLGALLPTAIEWVVVRYRREPERLFSACDRVVADWIRISTPKDAVFLTANSTVHLVPALAGRRAVDGAYTRATGFADLATQELVARAYREANPSLITKIRVTHVMVGPEEEGLYHVNRKTMERRYPVLFDQWCLGTRYTVYAVHERSAEDVRRDQEYEDSRQFVWLSELDPTFVQQQYGSLKYDKTFNLQPLTLRGQRYDFGLGTHAFSEIRFNLDKEYSLFESIIGLDDSQAGGIGSVVFEVWVDDRKAYKSKILRAGDPPKSLSIDVSGAATLKLIVTDGGDGNHCDHADWAEARLVRRK